MKLKKSKGKKRALDKKMIGAIEQVNSSYNFDNTFGALLREMDEMEGGEFGAEDDNVFDADGGEFDDDFGGDDETITLSELRNMTLGEIVDLLAGGVSDDDDFSDEGDDFDFEGDTDETDEIPLESYGFSGGEGNPKGAQGNYDGKARALPKTNHVKGNGDADFGKAKTGIKTSSGKKEKNYF